MTRNLLSKNEGIHRQRYNEWRLWGKNPKQSETIPIQEPAPVTLPTHQLSSTQTQSSDACSTMSDDDDSRDWMSSSIGRRFGLARTWSFGRKSRQSSPTLPSSNPSSPKAKPVIAIPSILKQPTNTKPTRRKKRPKRVVNTTPKHRRSVSWNEEVEELTILNFQELALHGLDNDNDDTPSIYDYDAKVEDDGVKPID